MIRARLTLRVSSSAVSRSLAQSITPDNIGMKGLIVEPMTSPSAVKYVIKYDGKVETFISTVEDMLRCIQAASVTLKKIGN
jgi:hypothetical protein